nr:DUF1343 domain-containing protein [Saccharopolyspora sp. HNM0983]
MSTSALAVPVGGVLTGAACAAPAAGPDGGGLRCGADVAAADGWRAISGRRVAVLTNPTGVLRSFRHIVDAMHESGGVRIAAVLGPEHGFRGTAQAGAAEQDGTDPRTGLPVLDTYGADAQRLARTLRDIGADQVVFDIADVGARFYTYIWTMLTALRAAAEIGAGFLVLDRPNPVGDRVSGPLLDPAFSSGVGELPIALQHGMTVGELARMFAAEHVDGAPQPEVVQVEGWSGRRPATGPWVPPSPNIPTPDTAAVYPGTGLFEGTTLSEGRGTTRPFETIGAPGIDWRWAEALGERGIGGIRFRETWFEPVSGKHAGSTCGGVALHRTGELDPVAAAVHMLVTARELYPEVFGWREDGMADLLYGSDRLRSAVDAGTGAEEIIESWAPDITRFREQREPHLLYR